MPDQVERPALCGGGEGVSTQFNRFAKAEAGQFVVAGRWGEGAFEWIDLERVKLE